MIRFNPPFNGKRYLLNTNSCEIHDLENEEKSCNIEQIKYEHVVTDNKYLTCVIHANMNNLPNPNKCKHCMKKTS